MKRRHTLLLLLLSPFAAFGQHHAKTGDLQFIENVGQWESPVEYVAGVYGGELFLEKNAFTYHFSNAAELGHFKHDPNAGDPSSFVIKNHAFKVHFLHSDPLVQLQGESIFDNYYNYFLGNDQSKWKGKVSAFGAVRYANLYPGIDMQVYSQSQSMKYDYIIQPGISPAAIQIGYEGLDAIQLNDGNLELKTSINTVVEVKPLAYQIIQDKKVIVPCSFVLNGNVVSYSFPEGYNTEYSLIIDPATLIFASYTGSTADNWGYTATYDNDGNLYGGGITFANGYPVTIGAYQETWTPGAGAYVADITVSKFSADGTSLIYSTYLGGSNEDLPYSLIVNEANELIIYGATGSNDFPTTAGAYDASFNGGVLETVDYVLTFTSGSDAFVAKLSADGADLVGSTYIGGTANESLNTGVTSYNYGDHARGEVNLDGAGNIYIAGCTRSTNFPTTAGVMQNSNGGALDGFVAKFNPALTSLSWSTYVGGNGDDGAYAIKYLSSGDVVIVGGTSSNNLNTTPSALHPSYQGGLTDGYVLVMTPDASSIAAMTYIGTSAYDQTYLLDVDELDNIYITGQTLGDYPIVGTVYSNPGSAQYISKLNTNLSTLLLSTLLGDGDAQVNISPTAFLVDNCHNIFLTGWGGLVNSGFNPATGSMVSMPITADAFQSSTDGSDFYLIIFGNELETMAYATYFGGSISDEHVDGGTSRFDKQGIVYHAVCAGCGGNDDFPTTEGVVSNTNNAFNCNLGVFKFSLGPPPTAAAFLATPDKGCVPLEVFFENESINADSYEWDFGDGTTGIATDESHVYTEPGTYTIRLVASVDDECGINDTVYQTVEIYEIPIADFTSSPDIASVYYPVEFTDASIVAVEWDWSFGDGFTSSLQNPTHLYADRGTYTVCLVATNADGCSDTTCREIIITALSLLDVPNAFSPNGDGTNDVFLPLNYGLTDFLFRVYNRWGELIYETTDPTKGWNGIYNGVEQEMDVYVYTVSGKGEDNVFYSKQGNFTLVR